MDEQARPTDDERQERSVLDTVEALTGRTARVQLSGSGSGAEAPVEARTTALRRKGRGTYEILGEIARGGMGVVFRGHDTELGRDVALKVLDEGLAKNPAVLQRFVEEAQIGGQLQHPGIVPVYELGLNADDRPFFTMKLVKGRTLSALLAERASVGDDRLRFLKIFESVCQTVAYAHSKGVIHRDLKPSNVMVGAFGEVHVVDWGLAKVLGRETDEAAQRAHSRMTVIETVRSGSSSGASDSVVGSVMGTPAYMPPEQASGEVDKLDARSDVFALGAILCEILTGAPPYVAKGGDGKDDAREIVRLAAKAKLDDAKQRISASTADEALKEICLECLTPARAARPQDAGELARALHDHLVSTEKRAQEAEIRAAEERRRRRLTVALAATVLVAVAAVGGGWLWVEDQREARVAGTQRLFAQERDKALDLQEQGRFEDALASALSALRLTEAGEPDDALHERALGLVEQARSRVEQQRAELALAAKNRALIDAWEELRLREVSRLGQLESSESIDGAYAAIFRDYGLDMDADDLGPALEAMRVSEVPETFAFMLDSWALNKRQLRDDDPWPAERLQRIATDLDPHPLRRELRRAILARDLPGLLGLEDSVDELPPPSVWVLQNALWMALGRGRAIEVIARINERAVELHPDDFFLNVTMAWACESTGHPERGEAFALAAHGLRPDDAYATGVLGTLLHMNGRLPEAGRMLRRAIALKPDWPRVYALHSINSIMLGDFAPILEVVELAREHLPETETLETDALVARSMLGELGADELLAWAEDARQTDSVVSVAYALVDHVDRAQRRPEAALDLLRRRLARVQGDIVYDDLLALVSLRLGDGPTALAACERLLAEPTYDLAWINHCFFRAQAHQLVGEPEEAARWFETGDLAYRRMTSLHADEWSRADPTRYRADALALLGR